jgi:hypothetical protein
MNTSYLIYQAERTKTAAEQRAIDRSAGELAASLARRWHSLAALSKGQQLRRGQRSAARAGTPAVEKRQGRPASTPNPQKFARHHHQRI